MRLSCPNCQTEYDVPEAALNAGGRMLRCAHCGHQWRHGMDAVPAAETPAPALDETPGAPKAPMQGAVAPPAEPAPSWPPAAMPDATPKSSEPVDEPPAPKSSWLPQNLPTGQTITPSGDWMPPSPSETLASPPPVEERVFGKPVDETARAEIVSAARDEELAARPEPGEPNPAMGAPLHGAAAPASRPAANQDGFAALVQAARNRAIEYEPEHPPSPPKVRASSTLLVVILAVLLAGALVVLERAAIMEHIPASRPFFHKLGLA